MARRRRTFDPLKAQQSGAELQDHFANERRANFTDRIIEKLLRHYGYKGQAIRKFQASCDDPDNGFTNEWFNYHFNWRYALCAVALDKDRKGNSLNLINELRLMAGKSDYAENSVAVRALEDMAATDERPTVLVTRFPDLGQDLALFQGGFHDVFTVRCGDYTWATLDALLSSCQSPEYVR